MEAAHLTGPKQEPGRQAGDFGAWYTRLREREAWLSSDEELSRLPLVPAGHPHYREWAMRAQSCARLCRYLASKPQGLRVLEVGCGNGWLSYQLARLPGSRVTGIDINATELTQARRVFVYRSNLEFVLGDIRSGVLADRRYDAVVFAASMQYFPDLRETVRFVQRSLLRAGGELHILDTPFYAPQALGGARQRTRAYFEALGCPEMTAYYFHHSRSLLQELGARVAYDPSSLWQRWRRHRNPFCWYIIGQGRPRGRRGG